MLKKAVKVVKEYDRNKIIIPIKAVAREMLIASDRKPLVHYLTRIPNDVKMIVFSSCNYETEIMQLDSGNTLILTCNNEQSSWDIALARIKDIYGQNSYYIEYSEIYNELVYNHPYCEDYEERFYDLDEEFTKYFTFNIPEFAKNIGPVTYIGSNGVILYENEKRICIK